MYRSNKGEFLKVTEMTEGWAGLLEKMQSVEKDVTVLEFLDKYFPAPGFAALRSHVTSFLEGFDLADISRASVKSILKEWLAEEDDNYRLPQGYGAMINYLAVLVNRKGVKVRTGMQVTSVSWQEGEVVVYTKEGHVFQAKKLLVTVPVSMLQIPPRKGGIRFTPKLHFNQQLASMIGFGAVVKIILKFRNTFWQRDAGFILSDQPIPTWWTQSPSPGTLLTGWVGGPPAAALSGSRDELILKKALSSLAAIYHCSPMELTEHLVWYKVFNWQKMEYFRGGYSFATLETPVAQQLISTPLADTIFFAGEGLYSGEHPGTVEAAISSGMNVSGKIKSSFRH
jgi:monoamine oxidase